MIIIAALLLIIVLSTARWLVSGNVRMLVMLARYGLMGMACVALVLLGLTGKLSALLIGLLACLPLTSSFRRLFEELQGHFKEEESVHPTDLDRTMAATILGISTTATAEEVKTSHKHLIQKIHPDKGGSAYLAQEVNNARDILLKKREES